MPCQEFIPDGFGPVAPTHPRQRRLHPAFWLGALLLALSLLVRVGLAVRAYLRPNPPGINVPAPVLRRSALTPDRPEVAHA